MAANAEAEVIPNLEWPPDFDGEDIEQHEHDFEWENLTGELTDFMRLINPDGLEWHAEVKGFGWRGLDGEKGFKALTGEVFLSELLPNTENSFKIYFDEKERKITINNAHHDKPTGGEMYYVIPLPF